MRCSCAQTALYGGRPVPGVALVVRACSGGWVQNIFLANRQKPSQRLDLMPKGRKRVEENVGEEFGGVGPIGNVTAGWRLVDVDCTPRKGGS